MSNTMLLGILKMPTDTWRNDALDISQRHSRYLQAAETIEALSSAAQAALKLLGTCLVVEGHYVLRSGVCDEVKAMLSEAIRAVER